MHLILHVRVEYQYLLFSSNFSFRGFSISFFFSFWVGGGGVILQELAITSDEALSLEELPKRTVVVGGGYVLFFLYIYLSEYSI